LWSPAWGSSLRSESGRTCLEQTRRRQVRQPKQVDYINAHATSTPIGDARLATIRSVFGSDHGPGISSTKSATGHLLGAAGVFEVVVSLLALRDGTLPPNLNLTDLDGMAAGLDLLGATARRSEASIAISNAFGFGGVNASIVPKRWSGT
jgi:3-oxoacyl-[acyl-carrier-protein] synthase II